MYSSVESLEWRGENLLWRPLGLKLQSFFSTVYPLLERFKNLWFLNPRVNPSVVGIKWKKSRKVRISASKKFVKLMRVFFRERKVRNSTWSLFSSMFELCHIFRQYPRTLLNLRRYFQFCSLLCQIAILNFST